MPIYEYQCSECNEIEEAVQKMSDAPLETCRHCSGKLYKLISQSSFHLKGTGWYVTDYKDKNKKKPDGAVKKDKVESKKKIEKKKND